MANRRAVKPRAVGDYSVTVDRSGTSSAAPWFHRPSEAWQAHRTQLLLNSYIVGVQGTDMIGRRRYLRTRIATTHEQLQATRDPVSSSLVMRDSMGAISAFWSPGVLTSNSVPTCLHGRGQGLHSCLA
jgi:hypothetical protein